MIESISKLVNADAGLVRRGRFVDTAFVIAIDNTYYHVRVEHGRIAKIVAGPFINPDHSFVLRASRKVWVKFWQPLPPPGFNDIFALTKQKLMRIEGNLHPLMANLLYFKDVVAAPRRGSAP
jgi:membrane-associated protease RseP (regulator of RpoE activity)